MKNVIIVALLWLMAYGLNATAEEGKNIFNSLRCSACHKVDSGKMTPSLEMIAETYKGKDNQLLSYLMGETEPIINPPKGSLMKKQIEKTKALKETEIKALIDFIIGYGH